MPSTLQNRGDSIRAYAVVLRLATHTTAHVTLPSLPLCPGLTSLESELCISRILFPFLSLPLASEPWTSCEAVTSHADLRESNQACKCWDNTGSHTFDVSRWVSTEQSHESSCRGAPPLLAVLTCRLLAMDHSHPVPLDFSVTKLS